MWFIRCTRPKRLTQFNGEEWIIKSSSSSNDKNIGKQEYEYALCAKRCGLVIPEVNLFPLKICDGYFCVKRFDHNAKGKVFMISVSALLETNHRIPNLDYEY